MWGGFQREKKLFDGCFNDPVASSSRLGCSLIRKDNLRGRKRANANPLYRKYNKTCSTETDSTLPRYRYLIDGACIDDTHTTQHLRMRRIQLVRYSYSTWTRTPAKRLDTKRPKLLWRVTGVARDPLTSSPCAKEVKAVFNTVGGGIGHPWMERKSKIQYLRLHVVDTHTQSDRVAPSLLNPHPFRPRHNREPEPNITGSQSGHNPESGPDRHQIESQSLLISRHRRRRRR